MTDETDRELLRLAEDLDDGQAVDWAARGSTDPAIIAGVEGLRDIEAYAAAMGRDPEPFEPSRAPREWLEPGSMLGRYPVEREAGRGGMGVVYLAHDRVLDRPVALKLLPPDVALSPERLARFTREAKLLASLNHPNVATIHGLEESAGFRFLVLEWVTGESLAMRLRRGPLPWRQALEVCGQIARGLAAAHEGGVIHRDLKPGNVMITPQGQVKVLDFGLARSAIAPADLPAGPSDPGIKGTWGYLSPECLTLAEDHRADVFAFGCVLYECLTGAPAFPGAGVPEVRYALLHHEPDEARLPADTPPAIRRLIASCVVKDPGRRLGSMTEALRTIEAALGRHPAPAAARPGTALLVPHRLPDETDAFVGREDELAELVRRLREGARLVTLQGAGGMGKTRLATRYGWRCLEEWPGGVWFCDLTEARTRDGIAAAVAGVLNVPLGPADPVEQLGHAIAGRERCVLVLDNFEQVVAEAGAAVTPWLARAPEARFVVTSRERLGLPDEEVQTIGPLGSEAGVELFVERARRQRPRFDPEGPEAESVREAVRLVEGIPLAIELAAARVRMMTPGQIVARMRERFRLLAGSAGGRHGTLRTAIDGSWELLDPWEQATFAQCAVFEGGFTLEAAEGVLDLAAWPEAPWVPDIVQSLVDKSLLRTWVPTRAGDEEPIVRFGMFVSLQEYARARLEEDTSSSVGSGSHAALAAEQRHGRWFAGRGSDETIDGLFEHGGLQRRAALTRDLENLVAACRRAAAREDGATAVASFRAAAEVLQFVGPSGVAVALGREVAAATLEDDVRRLALSMLGDVEWRARHFTEALQRLEEALDLHHRASDRRWEGITLGTMGSVHIQQGRMKEARSRLEAALTIARDRGDQRRLGLELGRLGHLDYELGRMEEARRHCEAALLIVREVGDRNLEGVVLAHLGHVHRDQGRVDQARTHLELALVIAREAGNRRFECITRINLANVFTDQGRTDEAGAHYESAIAIAREVGDRSLAGCAQSGLATLQILQGRLDEGRIRLEAALAIHREVGNRKFEGNGLGELGQLHLEQGRTVEARDCITRGSLILREIGSRIELGRVICAGAELEHRCGDPAAAHAQLREAEEIAIEVKAGPDSDLAQMIAHVRRALAAPS